MFLHFSHLTFDVGRSMFDVRCSSFKTTSYGINVTFKWLQNKLALMGQSPCAASRVHRSGLPFFHRPRELAPAPIAMLQYPQIVLFSYVLLPAVMRHWRGRSELTNQHFRSARRMAPPSKRDVCFATTGGFDVNPEPLNPEPWTDHFSTYLFKWHHACAGFMQ